MTHRHDCPHDCYQGSTDFYDSPDTDDFTPSYLVAQPLVDNVGTRKDGSVPPWMKDPMGAPGDRVFISPAQRYVEWFNGIWHTGDQNSWDAAVFTHDAVMIDPTGISRGAKQAAGNFMRLFEFYPELRGEVVSWAANDREIFINWRFSILSQEDKAPILVAVVDKFCFVDGRVSFRLASFDLVSFAGYLSENFGGDHLLDYLGVATRNALATGGIQSLPSIIRSFLKGIFLWFPMAQPSGLIAIPSDDRVSLKWPAVKDVSYYRLCRATAFSGPYNALGLPIPSGAQGISTVHYEDTDVEDDVAYWYIVTPYFEQSHSMPVKRMKPLASPPGHETSLLV